MKGQILLSAVLSLFERVRQVAALAVKGNPFRAARLPRSCAEKVMYLGRI